MKCVEGMILRDDQAKLQSLLKETITLLCKNGLHFKNGFIIDALIGITTDDSETFLVKLEEIVGDVAAGSHTKAENIDADPDDRSRVSRKRGTDRGSDGATATKQQRTYSDDDDYEDDDQSDENVDSRSVKRESADGHMVMIKQEKTGHDYQYTPNYNQSQDYAAPPDGSFDGGSHDGSLTWNQPSTNNDHDASGSQQVCPVSQQVCPVSHCLVQRNTRSFSNSYVDGKLFVMDLPLFEKSSSL